MPSVSINLCCYNAEPYLGETLQSIFAQTFADWELVIVNDGSTDGTDAIVRRCIGEGWPIVYQNQANTGLGPARNKALELSRGEFVAFMDQDDVWLPHKLEAQMAILDHQPNLGAVYSDYYLIDAAGRIIGRGSEVDPFARGWVMESLLACNCIAIMTVVAPRKAVEAVGGFRPFQIVEDYDLWLRLAANYRFDYVAEPLAKYRLHEGQLSRNFALAVEESLVMIDAAETRFGGQRPRLRSAFQRARARFAYNAAKHALFEQRDPRQARHYALLSIRFESTLPAVALYLLTFLGAGPGSRVRDLQRPAARLLSTMRATETRLR